MRTKHQFFLTPNHSDFDDLVRFFECVEYAEQHLGIEFAAGVEGEGENQKPLFPNDYLSTDNEDEFLEKYDGKVIGHIFRVNNTKRVYDTKKKACRLDIVYDDQARWSGNEAYSEPKLVTRGI